MPVDMAGYYPQSVKNIRAEMFESATDGAKNGIFLPELGSSQVRTGKFRFLLQVACSRASATFYAGNF